MMKERVDECTNAIILLLLTVLKFWSLTNRGKIALGVYQRGVECSILGIKRYTVLQNTNNLRWSLSGPDAKWGVIKAHHGVKLTQCTPKTWMAQKEMSWRAGCSCEIWACIGIISWWVEERKPWPCSVKDAADTWQEKIMWIGRKRYFKYRWRVINIVLWFFFVTTNLVITMTNEIIFISRDWKEHSPYLIIFFY